VDSTCEHVFTITYYQAAAAGMAVGPDWAPGAVVRLAVEKPQPQRQYLLWQLHRGIVQRRRRCCYCCW